VISFRYHVFTIVAIFLAVALGIAVGNAYVQPALVRNLQGQTNGLRNDVRDLESKLSDVTAAYGRLMRGSDILSSMDTGSLAGVPVVVVAEDGVDAEALTQARSALDQAEADIVGMFSVTDRMAADDAQTRSQLAELLGMSASASPDDVTAAAAQALATRLVAGPPRRGAQPGGADILDELLRGQFLAFPQGYSGLSESDLVGVGGGGEVIVVITGGEGPLALAPESFMVPLVRSALDRGASVGAGEPSVTTEPFVETLRSDGGLDGATLVTVDDLEWPIGGAALVLGLERLVTLGDGGDYGVKGGAEAPVPPIR
jgi:Copper transport outer membrane protein, MctB